MWNFDEDTFDDSEYLNDRYTEKCIQRRKICDITGDCSICPPHRGENLGSGNQNKDRSLKLTRCKKAFKLIPLDYWWYENNLHMCFIFNQQYFKVTKDMGTVLDVYYDIELGAQI